jgi:hypothetical protein
VSSPVWRPRAWIRLCNTMADLADELVKIWKEGKKTATPAVTFECKYCKKAFRRESTLAVHQCEPKTRAQQQNEMGVQMGYSAYLTFYSMTQGSAKNKSYEEFSTGPYYNAFVKFGRHCKAIRCINFTKFTEWLLKNNKKLDQWCSDAFYTEWMYGYLRKEAAQDALERSLLTMQDYVDEHPELKNGLVDYFRYGNANKICHHIATGHVSPWVVFNCDSGIAFLETLNEDQVALIIQWIEPDYWQRRFKDLLGDSVWVKEILGGAGL